MAYKYSPIKRIEIKNFRNLGHVELNFDESPIISLIGENEAGKTSVVKAFSVCALHSTPRDQKDFIRDGTDGFGVAIQLDDGTVVTRIKTNTLNRYTVTRPDGQNFDATKLDSGLPPAVQEVMGLIEEPETKEFLQVRTYEDRLLFVVTPASTNYKVMYDALKVDQITRAIKIGSKEANSIKATIDSNENGIDTLTNNLRAIRVFDISSLLNIRDRLNKELKQLDKLEEAAAILDNIQRLENSLGILSEVAKLGDAEINYNEANQICEMQGLLGRLNTLEVKASRFSGLDEFEELEVRSIISLEDIVTSKAKLDKALSESASLVALSDAEEINEAVLYNLISAANQTDDIASKEYRLATIDIRDAAEVQDIDTKAVNELSSIMDLTDRVNVASKSYESTVAWCKQTEAYMKQIGAHFEICPSCGADVLIDLDKYNEA